MHSYLSSPNFFVTAPPSVNATVRVSQDVYERDTKPYKAVKGTWLLGSIKGVLRRGKSITVLEIVEIEGENQQDKNIWVKAMLQ